MIEVEPHRYEPDGQHCTYQFSDGTWCFEPEEKHAPGGYKEASGAQLMSYPIVVTKKTVEIQGIELPWQRFERYGPAKGTMVESGVVFVPMSTLHELAEQDVWDSQFGSICLLGFYEGLALEAAGLAEPETRGGFHRTEKLLTFLREEESKAL